MIKVAFVGDPNNINPKTDLGDGPEVMTFMGTDFPKGTFVEIDDKNPENKALVAKLRNNDHFVVEGVEKPKKNTEKTEK